MVSGAPTSGWRSGQRNACLEALVDLDASKRYCVQTLFHKHRNISIKVHACFENIRIAPCCCLCTAASIAGPDPGQYFRQLGASGPAHSFPSGKRSGLEANDAADSPGPADHNADVHSAAGPAWTLTGRPESKAEEDKPGPGK